MSEGTVEAGKRRALGRADWTEHCSCGVSRNTHLAPSDDGEFLSAGRMTDVRRTAISKRRRRYA